MENFLIESDSSCPIGYPQAKRIFKIKSGNYAGRLIALMLEYLTSSGDHTVLASYSDYPYREWCMPITVCTDVHDYPFDAAMDDYGNISMVYTDLSTMMLVSRKLAFSGGDWIVGPKVTVYSGDTGFYPSVRYGPDAKLHLSWNCLTGGQFYVHYKNSDDLGTSWGSGPSDSGTILSDGISSGYSKLIINSTTIVIAYEANGNSILGRKRLLTDTEWQAEEIYSIGTGLDHNYDINFSDDGKIGLVYIDDYVRFREYDGANWSSIVIIDSESASFPQVRYQNNNPYIFYLREYGDNQKWIVYVNRTADQFSEPTPLNSGNGPLNAVLCYYSSAGTYADLTATAADDSPADIYHPLSLVLLKGVGDAVYFGLNDRFDYLRIILSTVGVGGTVSWKYFDGSSWKSFVPSGGVFHFSSLDKQLPLWPDRASIPADWQMATVNGLQAYFVKAEVTSEFTAGPVGTMITAVHNCTGLIILE